MYCSPKFGQLILTKIITIVATRCDILRPKCTKFDFGWRCAPDTLGEPIALRQLVGRGPAALAPSPRTPPSALRPSGLDPAVLTHFSFPNIVIILRCNPWAVGWSREGTFQGFCMGKIGQNPKIGKLGNLDAPQLRNHTSYRKVDRPRKLPGPWTTTSSKQYLSNRAIFNDFERPQTQISRSDHSLTLTFSEMAKDTAILLWKANRKPYPSFQIVSFSMTLSDL